MSAIQDYWGKNDFQESYYEGNFDYIDEKHVSEDFRICREVEYREMKSDQVKNLQDSIKELCWLNRQHHKKMNSIKPVTKFNKMIIF